MKKIYPLILTVSIVFALGCGKDFLEIKRDRRQTVPSSINDLQALLDDATRTMNSNSSHELGMIGADEISLTYEIWRDIPNRPYQKNGYVWAKSVYEGINVNDWDQAYRRILFANTALDGIDAIKPSQSEQNGWNNVKGSAMFFRALNFYQLAQLFCKPYNNNSAENDPGIPLRLEPDITIKSVRASVEKTYQQIITDLKSALDFLPDLPSIVSRPSKASAYALLARICLQMEDYSNAGLYSNECLKLKGQLNDLNNIALTNTYTFPAWGTDNPEVIYMGYMTNIAIVTSTRLNISPEILGLYADGDLRKMAYFRTGTNNRVLFKGSYTGSITLFTGFAVDEVLLIKAESSVRTGNIPNALADINQLLKARYDITAFVPVSATSAQKLLDLILVERRKELVLRGVRWEDLRRLNKEAQYAKTLTRDLNGTTYTLQPNDIRYVWPIPDKAIDLGGYEQNPR